MVSSVTPYTESRNRAPAGAGYDGVVRVVVAGHYGTGSLLYDGRAVLTAAHLFSGGATGATVWFETDAGRQSFGAVGVTPHPGYDPAQTSADLALVWLDAGVPLAANRYHPYRAGDEIGQTLTLAGYGAPATGASGVLSSFHDAPIRQQAQNQFQADISTLNNLLGASMGWAPTPASQLVADFDDGSAARDALGLLINVPGTGLGQSEGLISPGDSGGPAFLDGRVAGVASYTASLSMGALHPDIDDGSDSSYGEIAAWQRVSFYQQWIDQSMRAHYPNAPTSASEVRQSVPEGDGGTSYAYFLLEFTAVRSDPNQILSVDYATRDGSASAGLDYVALRDTLRLYPGENQAVIAVEVIGDTLPEASETFFLDVTNPVGGSFGALAKLVATRTIVDDDAPSLAAKAAAFSSVAIAHGVWLENVSTGSVAGTIRDNAISAGAGDDLILLFEGGYDTADGGAGTDTVQVNDTRAQVRTEKQADGGYLVAGSYFGAKLVGVEKLLFTDGELLQA